MQARANKKARTTREDIEVTRLLIEYDRTILRLIELGITSAHLRNRVTTLQHDTDTSRVEGLPGLIFNRSRKRVIDGTGGKWTGFTYTRVTDETYSFVRHFDSEEEAREWLIGVRR